MKLSLTTAEKLVVIALCNLPSISVSAEKLKEFFEEAAKFGISDEDKTKNKWEEVTDADGKIISFKWDDTGVEPKKIEIGKFMEKFLKDNFSKLQYTPSDPMAQAAMSFWTKLNT